MNIAISSMAWNPEDEHGIIDVLKKCAVTGVEIVPTKIWKDLRTVSAREAASYQAIWSQHGVKIVSTQAVLFGFPGLNLFSPDQTVREATVEYTKKAIDVTSYIGATALVFGSAKNRWVPPALGDRHIELAIEFFSHVAEHAKTKNVFFCIEPIPPSYGCNFITNTVEAVDFLERVNHPYLCLNQDTAVMTINGEDYQRAIQMSAPYLRHCHISEPQLGLIGTGSVNHTSVADALRAIGYQHWVSVEMKQDLLPSNIDAVDRALKFVKRIYG